MPKLIQAVFLPTETLSYNQIAAAALLGISARTLRVETAAGRVRRTHLHLYPRVELERYLKATLIKNEVPTPRTSALEHLSNFIRKHKPGSNPELDAVWEMARKAIEKDAAPPPTEQAPEN